MANRGVRAWFSMSYLLANRWTIVTVAIVIFMLVVIGRNLAHAIFIRYEIAVLEGEKGRYQELITADSALIESLKYDKELERYARENYFMQRAKEEIFIVESGK